MENPPRIQINATSDTSVLHTKRTREIDVLVAHELAIGSPAAQLIWERAGVCPAPEPSEGVVEYQQDCNGQPDDVRARFGPIELSVEDKAVGGHFQVGQVENYARWIAMSPDHRVVLIAPELFISAHRDVLHYFSGIVSLEELSASLGAAQVDDSAELAAGYRHRQAEFKRCAESPAWTLHPDARVCASGKRYRELLAAKSGGVLQLTPNSLQSARARTVEFEAWAPGPNPGAAYQVQHKFNSGSVDLRVPDWGFDDLDRVVRQLSPDKALPHGWHAAQGSAGASYPVLRHEVRRLGTPFPVFEEVEDDLIELIGLVVDLHRWWDQVGSELLRGDLLFGWHLETLQRMAEQRGLTSLAGEVASHLSDATRSPSETLGAQAVTAVRS